MLLVFMVLLNFLLAIIVDAFGEVKEGTREKVGCGAPACRWVLAAGCCGDREMPVCRCAGLPYP